ncbi:hypothetical protein NDU88_004590 [Pleurodeles waltl]|uniref:Uncharacterized protein n=1 Tax=Pleurodeles waltl TaxID=8319 RepID=A0AAV7PG61_PLEWA|nr:hypothetical protein NDU88_004590 [Pleurodeles waltl]
MLEGFKKRHIFRYGALQQTAKQVSSFPNKCVYSKLFQEIGTNRDYGGGYIYDLRALPLPIKELFFKERSITSNKSRTPLYEGTKKRLQRQLKLVDRLTLHLYASASLGPSRADTHAQIKVPAGVTCFNKHSVIRTHAPAQRVPPSHRLPCTEDPAPTPARKGRVPGTCARHLVPLYLPEAPAFFTIIYAAGLQRAPNLPPSDSEGPVLPPETRKATRRGGGRGHPNLLPVGYQERQAGVAGGDETGTAPEFSSSKWRLHSPARNLARARGSYEIVVRGKVRRSLKMGCAS